MNSLNENRHLTGCQQGLTRTEGKVLAGIAVCRWLRRNCSVLNDSLRPGNRFSYSVGSARDDAALGLPLVRLSLHRCTTLQHHTHSHSTAPHSQHHSTAPHSQHHTHSHSTAPHSQHHSTAPHSQSLYSTTLTAPLYSTTLTVTLQHHIHSHSTAPHSQHHSTAPHS